MNVTLDPIRKDQRVPGRPSPALALTRFELPLLLRHPGFLLGFAIAGLLIVTSGPWDRLPGEPVIEHLTWGLGMMPVTMAVTFALLASRSRRNDVEQVEIATAGGRRARQTTLMMLTLVPGLILIAVGVLTGLVAEMVGVNKASMFSGPAAAESMLVLAQAAVAAIAICSFAVAAGTWLPHGITAALMVLVVLQGADTSFHPTAWDTTHPVPSLVWHLVYGAGVALLATTAALSRHRRDHLTWGVAGLGIVLTVAGGVLQ